MKKKQILCAILASAMLLSAMPMYAAAETEGTEVPYTEAETTDTPETEAPSESTDIPETEVPSESTDMPETETPSESTDTPETEQPEETPVETENPTPVTYTVTFQVGSQTSTVTVEENSTLQAGAIPTTDASGKAIVRWYTQDLSTVVDASTMVITQDTTLVAWFAPALRTDHSPYMAGTSSTTFGTNDKLTWSQVAQIIYNLLEDKSYGSFPYTYSDVSSSAWYYNAVCVTASLGIFNCDGGNFYPSAVVSRAEFVEVVTRLVAAQSPASNPFTDVNESSPNYQAIMTAYAKGWVAGTSSTTFSPDGALTRAQVVTIFNKILGRSADASVIASQDGLRSFSDLSPSHWAYGHIMEAAVDHTATVSGGTETWTWYDHTYSISLSTSHQPYVAGYTDGTFRPDQNISRAEACQMIYSQLSNKTKGGAPTYYPDVNSGEWYYDAVTTLASLGVVDAKGGNFNPHEAITRGELASMLANLIDQPKTLDWNFYDLPTSHPYYSVIRAVAAEGWMAGTGNGYFSPDAMVTRAQVVTVLNKITGRGTGDISAENEMDSRYTFSDVSASHWAYNYIMEASTNHNYTISNGVETWSSYYHTDASADWESSDSVVNAATIIRDYSSTYSGTYSHSYNVDYSDPAKERFVNGNGYSSKTNYLLWVSRACQKVYLFYGSKGNWELLDTYICGTGKSGTPVGVTYITYKQTGWYQSSYTVAPVVRFYPNSGYAFHSRLYYPGSSRLKDSTIGYPCSHGCIRMLTPDVSYIYNYVPVNTTVVVY